MQQPRSLLVAISLVGCGVADESSITQLSTLDPQTGIGFVAKGAVQSSFKWNNEGLQTNAAGVTFSFDSSGVYQQSCIHLTGSEHKIVQVTFKKTFDLSAAVDYLARRNPLEKITGFNLTGITGSTGDTLPTDLCNPGQSEPDGLWTPDPDGMYPVLTQTSGSPPSLHVWFDGVSHPIALADEEDDDAAD